MVTNRTVSAGRDLTETDCKTNARVCVIGETIRKYFFGAMSPIDQSIRIGGQSFKIVGVYKGKYGGKLNSEDQMIVLPYTLQSQMMRSSDSDHQYFIQAASKEDIQPVVDALKDFMSTRYDPNNGYFDCDSTSQYMDQVEASSNQLALLGGGIAAISLLVEIGRAHV